MEGYDVRRFLSFADSKVNLAVVDIDIISDLAMDHEVQAVPTVFAFKEGKVVDTLGLLDEDRLDAFVKY